MLLKRAGGVDVQQFVDEVLIAASLIGVCHRHQSRVQSGTDFGGNIHPVGFSEALPLGVFLVTVRLVWGVRGIGCAGGKCRHSVDFTPEAFLIQGVPSIAVDGATLL